MNPTKANFFIFDCRFAIVLTILFGALGLAPTSSFFASAQSSLPSPQSSSDNLPEGYAGDLACQSCHQDKFNSYVATAHHRTSRLPEASSIAGSFASGKNVMTTLNPELTFRMEARDGQFYETAIRDKQGRVTKRTEAIQLVIGSATKGQTYLYWKENGLYELPVSYWTELNHWVNSPGYVDGSADFDRPVPPRCLECHATFFQPVGSSRTDNHYDKNKMALGISCERCHGPGKQHIQTHQANSANSSIPKTMPPVGLPRDRQIDVCAQCHGGAGEPLAPAFSFRPGEKLSDYVKLQDPTATDRLDVHGNQVNLLARSRCYQSSPGMTCSTCHDPHSPERPAADYSPRCLECHKVEQCGMVHKLGTQIASNCVDCHMPVQASNLLVLDADDTRLKAKVRNHWIRVYQRNPSR
jgi:hypothetical protein